VVQKQDGTAQRAASNSLNDNTEIENGNKKISLENNTAITLVSISVNQNRTQSTEDSQGASKEITSSQLCNNSHDDNSHSDNSRHDNNNGWNGNGRVKRRNKERSQYCSECASLDQHGPEPTL